MRSAIYREDEATIEALRGDVALQLTRYIRSLGVTQVAAARQLGLPQPTLSKIANNRVSDVSLELLIRVSVRAGLPLVLQTGRGVLEAGAFAHQKQSPAIRSTQSKLADEARKALLHSDASLTPGQRLEAFLEHNQLIGALQQAGRAAEARRTLTPEP